MFDSEKHSDYFVDDSGNSESQETSSEAGNRIDFGEDSRNTTGQRVPAEQPASGGRRRGRRWIAILVVVCIVVISGLVYVRYFNPYAVESQVTGYVTNVERRGIIFKTYEGDMITESNLTDTAHVYSRAFTFTIPDAELARRIQATQGSGKKVKLYYSKYYGVLPWRGASKNVVENMTLEP